MDNLINDFFKSWGNEITSYQEVLLCLMDQKDALIDWNIKRFQGVSQQTAVHISRAHRATYIRNDLMESVFLMMNLDISGNNLKTLAKAFIEPEYTEKVHVMYKAFAGTLNQIDKLSAENKALIKTGLDLVGGNLEMIADVIDRDKVYSRVGNMLPHRRSSILVNRRA